MKYGELTDNFLRNIPWRMYYRLPKPGPKAGPAPPPAALPPPPPPAPPPPAELRPPRVLGRVFGRVLPLVSSPSNAPSIVSNLEACSCDIVCIGGEAGRGRGLEGCY